MEAPGMFQITPGNSRQVVPQNTALQSGARASAYAFFHSVP
jgi:hypothetical protein